MTLSRPPKTETPFRRVAILFAGGPAPAANAVISTAANSFLRNDIETVRIGALAGDEIFGEIRVRGIDALVDGRGIVLTQQVPLRVNVRRRDGTQTVEIPSSPRLWGILAVVAARVIAAPSTMVCILGHISLRSRCVFLGE